MIPDHKGKCKYVHGHSYVVEVQITGIYNRKDGMLVDFGDVKSIIDRFDHSNLNESFKYPSAENLARYFALKILRLSDNIMQVVVTVFETEDCCATETVVNRRYYEQAF